MKKYFMDLGYKINIHDGERGRGRKEKGGSEKEKSGIYVRVWKCFSEILISMQNNFPIIAG